MILILNKTHTGFLNAVWFYDKQIYYECTPPKYNTKTLAEEYFLFAVELKSVDGLMNQFIDLGLEVKSSSETPFGEFIYLVDPDGRKVGFYEMYI